MRKLLKQFPDITIEDIGESTSGIDTDDILERYNLIKPYIEERLNEFKDVLRKGNENRLFAELAFCILTPQSNARYCWEAICNLYESGKLFQGDREEIQDNLKNVRFKFKKAGYIVKARELLLSGDVKIKERLKRFKDTKTAREWLVKNIKGVGLKEASHFLRNVGFGGDIAILDRHILRNLVKYGVIDVIPNILTRRNYYDIENKFSQFAENTGIPLEHMDLLFWYNAKGEIFK